MGRLASELPPTLGLDEKKGNRGQNSCRYIELDGGVSLGWEISNNPEDGAFFMFKLKDFTSARQLIYSEYTPDILTLKCLVLLEIENAKAAVAVTGV